MKKNGGCNGVVDSMAAASGVTGVSMAELKRLKRDGCDAFRGSRVHLGKLREAIAAEEAAPSTSDVLLMIVHEVARRISGRLPHKDAKFRAECRRLTETVHMGFASALVVVEPGNVDQFLKRSATLFEEVFKSARKGHASNN